MKRTRSSPGTPAIIEFAVLHVKVALKKLGYSEEEIKRISDEVRKELCDNNV